MKEGQRIAVLASGGGTTFEAYVNAALEDPSIPQVGLVICNKPDAGIFEKVNQFNEKFSDQLDIKSKLINGELFPKGDLGRGQTAQESAEICKAIRKADIGFVALMGYMIIIPEKSELLNEYGWLPEYAEEYPRNNGIYLSSMLNTHPGILPATQDTWGVHASKKVLSLGLDKSAHTVHGVSANVDEGPIFAEHEVPVLKSDTPKRLFERIQKVEKAKLPQDIARFLKKQSKFLGDE